MIRTITIILPTSDLSDKINGILHKYSGIILGRMGLPRVEENEFILTIVLKSDDAEFNKLYKEIKNIKGVKSGTLTIE